MTVQTEAHNENVDLLLSLLQKNDFRLMEPPARQGKHVAAELDAEGILITVVFDPEHKVDVLSAYDDGSKTILSFQPLSNPLQVDSIITYINSIAEQSA